MCIPALLYRDPITSLHFHLCLEFVLVRSRCSSEDDKVILDFYSSTPAHYRKKDNICKTVSLASSYTDKIGTTPKHGAYQGVGAPHRPALKAAESPAEGTDERRECGQTTK